MSDELQCSKCGLVSDRDRRSLADDPQAVERGVALLAAIIETTPISARVAVWYAETVKAVLRAAEGEQT